MPYRISIRFACALCPCKCDHQPKYEFKHTHRHGLVTPNHVRFYIICFVVAPKRISFLYMHPHIHMHSQSWMSAPGIIIKLLETRRRRRRFASSSSFAFRNEVIVHPAAAGGLLHIRRHVGRHTDEIRASLIAARWVLVVLLVISICFFFTFIYQKILFSCDLYPRGNTSKRASFCCCLIMAFWQPRFWSSEKNAKNDIFKHKTHTHIIIYRHETHNRRRQRRAMFFYIFVECARAERLKAIWNF